jgi:hypothetical protein
MTTEPLQRALAVIDATPAANEAQELVRAKCRGLMRGYDKRWGVPDFKIVEVEQLITSDLYNPATQAKSRTFSVAGKIDLVGIRDGKRVLFDHKSSSENIEDPADPYWRQLIIESQPSHYALLKWLNGEKIDELVWDVIKKPAVRPRQVSKQDRMFTASSGVYFGSPISQDSLAELRATEKESLEMFEHRLAHDCTELRPQAYFQRRTVPRLDSDLLEHAQDIWDYSQEIIAARRLNRHPRNSGACMVYNRPCTYLGLCSGFSDAEDPSQWRKVEQVHRELSLEGTDGRDVLTNSRLTAFKTCRKKHFLHYELGIEKAEIEDIESLWMGALIHEALEAYFLAWKEIQEEDLTSDRSRCIVNHGQSKATARKDDLGVDQDD